MKKFLIGTFLFITVSSVHADYASYMSGIAAQSYCDTKWTMTFHKKDKNGKLCTKIGKTKWIKSCIIAYSKFDAPSSNDITKIAKKQWKIK